MTIEDRFEVLEREFSRYKIRNFWFSIGSIILLFIAITIPGISQSIPSEITGRSFKIVDEKGEPRILLGTYDGKPIIWLFSQNDHSRFLQPRISLSTSDAGKPGLILYDENGEARLMLGFSESGEPGLGLFDRNGILVWSTP